MTSRLKEPGLPATPARKRESNDMFIATDGLHITEADQIALGIRSGGAIALHESEKRALKEARRARKQEKRLLEASADVFADITGNARAGAFAARGR
jgi:hypothetical protein